MDSILGITQAIGFIRNKLGFFNDDLSTVMLWIKLTCDLINKTLRSLNSS